MNHMRLILPALAAALACTPLLAADGEAGKSLVEENCTGCHDSSVYTRDDRRITSLAALEQQVRRCELTLGLQWFDDDVMAVTEYLNSAFYQFK